MSALRQKLLTDFYCSPGKAHEPDPVPCSSSSEPDKPSVDSLSRAGDSRESLSPVPKHPGPPVAGGTPKVIRTVVLLGKENRKRRRAPLDDPKQMILDAGQKTIGHQYCKECGMVYDCDSLTDRREHEKFHSRFMSTEWFRVQMSQLNVWKRFTYCIREQFNGSYCYIFCVTQATKCTLKARTDKVILECVNKELGFTPDLAQVWTSDGRRQAWVLVTALDSYYFIAAVVLLEKVMKDQLYSLEENTVIARTDDMYMGVNRIWVHRSLRRKGLAAFLLDHARVHFAGSCPIPRERLAFSSLTENGLAFVKRYVPGGNVLLYRLSSESS